MASTVPHRAGVSRPGAEAASQAHMWDRVEVTGRPSSYTDAIADEICERLLEGESLRHMCRDDRLPNRSTVLRWLDADVTFAAKYARARELQADYMDDLILETADGCSPETAASDRVKIAAYQWRAAKLKAKVYGDKTLLGSDPENPLPSGFDVSLIAAPLKRLTDASKG